MQSTIKRAAETIACEEPIRVMGLRLLSEIACSTVIRLCRNRRHLRQLPDLIEKADSYCGFLVLSLFHAFSVGSEMCLAAQT
jgi:hypothetical protein